MAIPVFPDSIKSVTSNDKITPFNFDEEEEDKIEGNDFTKMTQAPEPVQVMSEREVEEEITRNMFQKTQHKDPFKTEMRTNEAGVDRNDGDGGDRDQRYMTQDSESEKFVKKNLNSNNKTMEVKPGSSAYDISSAFASADGPEEIEDISEDEPV